ncbi:GNAT family N-acetyltransferase [Nakamurella deserti]|uniref:GNAT family N-acetyltransferase n=1 Tax=Nakamurella deserti TaxID=2164074 RepID=UPI000DBE04EE|nr:GNAT family N-acetyltransferase [Nakamurella deserti]
MVPWYRAVVADGAVVGFVMLAEADAGTPVPYLWRLLVDRSHQRRGIGRQVVARVVDGLAARGHTALLVSWASGPGGPEPFYRGLGFEPTGERDGDETVARLEFGHHGRRGDSQV